ncbi:hypothetical protein [Anaerolentibacter hominis]|uniref:hypothetical protein n=1 Tax=Anaerolentibacter hominis TaxID=3079009 RepID=UPI0031B81106
MKRNSMIGYLAVQAGVFYLVPLLIRDTGSAVFFMLLVLPLITFMTAYFYGMKAGFRWYYGLIAAVMFIPAIPIHFNSSAWVYILGYGVLAFAGNGLGGWFHSRR